MLIAQISDLHIAEDGAFMRAFVDANAKLESAVSYLNRMTLPPDVVIATGDLTDNGRPDQYGLLREILDGLQIPLLAIPGNHDEREPFRAAFGDQKYLPAEGHLSYVIDDFPVRLVALDTLSPGFHHGDVDDARLGWLDEVLGARPDTPTMLCLHHPPFVTGIWWMDSIHLLNADALRELINRHPQVARVIAGHIHRPITTAWHHAVVSTAPSTTHQTRCDLDPDHAPVIAAEPPMLDLHWWTGDSFVSHTTVFEAVERTINFAALMPDWEQAKLRIKAGPPFEKGGAFG